VHGLALEVLGEMAASGLPVDGIGLTGRMHGLLCVDAVSEPLTRFISWQDR
jgi:sugar (pentulose or hexulose) kinase